MLRYKSARIYNAPVNLVPEFFFQCLHHDLESMPPIMIGKVFDILQEKSFWPMMGDDARNIKKQNSLGFTTETMRPVQGISAGYSGY